jgi:hypothetical protein
MAKMKARLFFVLGGLAVLLTVFSIGRSSQTYAARSYDNPVEGRLEDVARGQTQIMSALSKMQSDISSIMHDVQAIRDRTR